MFLWSLQIVGAIWFGWEVANFFTRSYFQPIVRLAIAIPLGQFIFAWIAFILSSQTALAPIHGNMASFIQLVLAYLIRLRNQKTPISFKQTIDFQAIIAVITFGAFACYLLYFAMLLKDKYTLGAGYGDFPFHLNIISSFIYGVNQHRESMFDIKSSFYAGERLAYPVMTNFYTAILMLSGRATQRAALFFPSLLSLLSLFCGIYVLSGYFSKRRWVGIMSLFLFLNLGGLSFMRWTDTRRKWRRDYVFHWGGKEHAYWFHPLLHILIPQRSALFSMPLCYWTLYLLATGVEHGDNRLMCLAGILTALCPQLQLHSYVGLAQWAIVFCLINFPYKNPEQWKKYFLLWACYGIIGISFGLPQFYPFIGRLSSSSARGHGFVRILPTYKKFCVNMPGVVPNWRAFFIMWWRGLGVFGFIALSVGLINADRFRMKLYLPSLVVWGITNVILYQPWECDNLKIHYAVWIPFALPLVSMYFLDLLQRRKTVVLGVVLLLAAVVSAWAQTWENLRRPSQLFRQADIDAGLWAAENAPADARFLTWLWHANPPATIGGKELFMGFGGWVVSHGLDFHDRVRDSRNLLMRPEVRKEFVERNISYVYSRSTDHQLSRFNKMEKSAVWKQVASYHNHRYWRLKKLP